MSTASDDAQAVVDSAPAARLVLLRQQVVEVSQRTMSLTAEAQSELGAVMPMLMEAFDGLKKLTWADLQPSGGAKSEGGSWNTQSQRPPKAAPKKKSIGSEPVTSIQDSAFSTSSEGSLKCLKVVLYHF